MKVKNERNEICKTVAQIKQEARGTLYYLIQSEYYICLHKKSLSSRDHQLFYSLGPKKLSISKLLNNHDPIFFFFCSGASL